ncbi:aldo/keto reductase [Microbacterium sp. CIAB417]|uniref:aldo/keto reductase n=1 Tax=Microbacterium sp. CIAB417 TaxID=2860287 RepID=UPI001FAD5214|nr:aldo/keto reductase [Microbacterium sp. CIAB417]
MTEIAVDRPALILGASSLGADPDTAEAAALAMLRSGLLVDTSNGYAGGRSERALGTALATMEAAERDAAASRILTKVDRDPETGVFDGDRVRRSFEESLERLGVDRLPLLHLHDPYTITVEEALAPGGAVEALVELKQDGLVDAIGIAAGPVPLLQRYVDSGLFDAVLCHNRFTLVDDSARSLYEAAHDRGMTVFNAAPFGGDLLVKGARADARYEYRPIGDDLAAWTAELFRVCADHGVPPAAVALRFSTRSPLVDHTVVGVSSPARIEQLRALDAAAIPEGVWADLAALGPAPSPVDDSRYGASA